MMYNDDTIVLDKDEINKNSSKSETELLEDALIREAEYDDFEKKYAGQIKEGLFLTELRKLMVINDFDVSKIYIESGLSRSYIYQLLNGDRIPSRDAIINLAIVFACDLNETNRLLKICEKQSLYAKNKRDSVIIYSISHSYTLEETNKLLKEKEQQLL